MKIPSPRESVTHLVHEVCFLVSVALSLGAVAGTTHGLLWLVSFITGEKIPAWLMWFAYGCDIIVATIFVVLCVSLHVTQMSKYLKDMWASLLAKSSDARARQENREAIIAAQQPSPPPEKTSGTEDET